MVSLGDTAISLHILQPPTGGVFWKVKTQSVKIWLNFFEGGVLENPKCQDMAKFQFWGRGVFRKDKIQRAKIWLNFNFQGGVLERQNPKSQDLVKLLFWREGCSGTEFQKKPKVPRSG